MDDKKQIEEALSSPEMWIEEKHHSYFSTKFKLKSTLFSQKSKYQKIDIVDTYGFGKILLNDGIVMLSERDERIYHEMISHVPMFVHPNPKKVLIIGGGDGGTAREVLRHPQVEICKMIEIDEVVVNACKKHITQTSCIFDNPKLDLKIEDGIKFVNETNEKFDIIIIDSTDPIGPAKGLFGKDFYQNIKRILNDTGIVISQAENPHFDIRVQIELLKILKDVFTKVHIYNFSNITYPGGLWSFTYVSNNLCPKKNFNFSLYKKHNLDFYYYNKEIHHSAFILPEFMYKYLNQYLTTIKT